MSSLPRPEPRIDWFVPIDGDGAHIGTARAERPPDFAYLREVVQTAEALDYYSLLVPTRFANGLFESAAPLAETWTTASALAAVTDTIHLLVAVRPGFVAPGLFAQMAATLDNLSGGRVHFNAVPGGIQGDFERVGVQTSHQERYAYADEFIEACRQLWASTEPVSFHGDTINLEGALVSPSPVGNPQWYLGGASDDALRLAARQADTLLMWIQPLDAIANLMNRAQAQFAPSDRHPRFGLRTHIIVRETESAAWAAADELLSQAAATVLAERQAVAVGASAVGVQAQVAKYDDFRVGPHLWNGISTVRVNCGTAIVGTPRQVADELLSYWRLGIDEFILSGFPHLEECQRVAQDVLPILRDEISAENRGG
jgi:alkanesulfonate monooxygenase